MVNSVLSAKKIFFFVLQKFKTGIKFCRIQHHCIPFNFLQETKADDHLVSNLKTIKNKIK